MICLDTDCIIDFLRDNEKAIKVISKYSDNLVTTEINVYEVFSGIYLYGKKGEMEIAENFFDNINILNFGGWGKKGANIFSNLIKKGQRLEHNDCLISAIAMVNGCSKIITNNKKHFSRIEGLEIITY